MNYLNVAQQPGAQQPVAEQPITDWHDYKAVSHKFDCLDYLIEMHGRIMGISLSPCHRYVLTLILIFFFLLSKYFLSQSVLVT